MQAPAGPDPVGSYQLQRTSSLGDVRKNVIEKVQHQFERLRRAASESRGAPNAKKLRTDTRTTRVHDMLGRKTGKRNVRTAKLSLDQVERCVAQLDDNFNTIVDAAKKEDEDLDFLEQKTKILVELTAGNGLEAMKTRVEQAVMESEKMSALLTKATHLELKKGPALAAVMPVVTAAREAIRKHKETIGDEEQVKALEWKIRQEAELRIRLEELGAKEAALIEELVHVRSKQLGGHFHEELTKYVNKQKRLCAAAGQDDNGEDPPKFGDVVKMVDEVYVECAKLREEIEGKKARLGEVRKLVEEKKARKAERKRKLLADVDEWKAKLAAAETREDEVEHAINVTDEKLAHGKKVQQEHESRRRKAEMLMKLNSQLRQKLGKNANETLAKFLVYLEKQATEHFGAAAAQELLHKSNGSSEAYRNRILTMKPDEAAAKVAADMEEETRAILERVIQKETVSEGEFAELNSVLIDLAEEATGKRLQALESQLEEVLDPWRKLLEKAKTAASEELLKRMDEVEAKYEANMKDSQVPSMGVMVEWVKEKKLDELVTKIGAKIDILHSCYEDLGRRLKEEKGSALEAATSLPIVAARERIREKLAKRIEKMETHVRTLADFLPTVFAKLEADEASRKVFKEKREKELAQTSVKLEESQAGIADVEAQKQQLQSTLDSVVSECKEYEDRIADGERIIENNRRRDEAYRLLMEAKKRKAAEAEKRRQELLARKEDDEREIETLIQLLEELKQQEKVELREIDETANKVRETKLEEGKLQVESAEVQRIAVAKLAELSKESVKHEVRRTFYEERVKVKEERKQGLKKKREEILAANPKLYFERFQGLTVAGLKKKTFEAHVRLANIRGQLTKLDETEQKERREFDRLLENLDYHDGAVTSAKVNRKKLRAQGRALKKKLAEAEASVARDLTLRREELDVRCILELHEAKYSGMTLEEALEREVSELDSVRARKAKFKLAIKKVKKILEWKKRRKLKRRSARAMVLKASRTISRSSCVRTPQIKRSSDVKKFNRRTVTPNSKTKPPSKLAGGNQQPKFSRNISEPPSKLAQSAENSNSSRSGMELPSKVASGTKPISIVGTKGPVKFISSDQQTSVFTSAMEQKCKIIGSQPVDAASSRIVQPSVSVASNQGNEGSSVMIEEPSEAPRNVYQNNSLSSKKEWLPESLKCIQKGESSRSKVTQPFQAIASNRRANGLSSSLKMEQPPKVATSYQNAGIASSSAERKSGPAGGHQATSIVTSVTELPSQCVAGEQQMNCLPSKVEQPPKIGRSNSRRAKQQVRFSSPLELPTPELKAEPPKPLLERKNSGSSSWKLDQRKKNIWYFESDDDYQPTARKNSASSNQRVVADAPGRDEETRASRGRSVERKEKGLSDGRDAREKSAVEGNDMLEKAEEKAKMKPESEQGGRKSRLRSVDGSEPGLFAFEEGDDKAKEKSDELEMGVGGEKLKENPGKTEEAKHSRSHSRKRKETCLRDGAIAEEPSKEGVDRKGCVVGGEKANGESGKADAHEELVPGSKDRTGKNWLAGEVEKDTARGKYEKVLGSALLPQNATGPLDTSARVRVGRDVDKRTKSSGHGRAMSAEKFGWEGKKNQHPSTAGVVGQDGMKAKVQIGGSKKAEEEKDHSTPNVVVAKANGKLESKASTGLSRCRDTHQRKGGAEALRAREKAGPSKRENVGKPGTRNVGRTAGAKPAASCLSTEDRPKGSVADSEDWKPLTSAKGKEAEKRKLEGKKSATPSDSSGWKIHEDDDAVPETPKKMRKKREIKKASTPCASSSWIAFDSDSQKTKYETEGEKKQDPKKAVAGATTSRWKAYDDDDPRAANKGGASARAGTSGSKKEDGEKKVKKTHGLLTLRNPEKVVFDMSMSDVEPDKEPVIDWSKF